MTTATGTAPSSLWRHRDFLMLWGGQTVSELGSAVTTVALPLTAVVWLKASTFQVGLLSAATMLAFLVIAVPAGLIVDRMGKRPLMIGCDVARMVIIGSVPVAYAAGLLTLAQLYVVALLAGIATVFFDVAYQSYVPHLIGTDQLVDGNGKLGATMSFAQVAGPGLGGALFGLLKAAAMSVDAASYAVSWLALLAIKGREPRVQRPAVAAQERKLLTELLAGLSFVLRHRVLRKVAACTGTSNLFNAMTSALEIIFLVRVLHVPAAWTGALLALGSVGGVVGGVVSGWVGRRLGTARLIWVSILGPGAIATLMPLAEPGWRLALVPLALFSFSFSGVLYNIGQVSYRQAICPPELMGRMNAAIRWIVWGTLPIGGLLGGALGTAIGVRPTIAIGAIGSWAAGFWVLASPLRGMRDIPASAAADAAALPGTA